MSCFKHLPILLILLTFYVNSWSQEDQKTPLFDPQQKKYQTSLEKFYRDRSIIRPTVSQVLEDELSAADYIVGPGDLFKISILGQIENEFNFQVLPEGVVIIPTIGEIAVSDLTLKEAKSEIKEKAKLYYINTDIAVNLVGLRRFRVYLTGEVEQPGTYFAQGSDRISDILEIGGGITDWADDTKIEIRQSNGKTGTIDLNYFYLDGILKENPFVHAGDLIHVPSINIREHYVIIEGHAEIASRLEENIALSESNLLGVYPIKEDERLYAFLRRIGALSKKSNLEELVLVRGGEEFNINLLASDDETINFKLQHKDKIYIPRIIDRVYVKGQVFTPGSYPYYANYTAKDYVGQAGAIEGATDPDGYVVIRRSSGEYLKGGDVLIEKGDLIIVRKSFGEDVKDFLIVFTPILSLAATLVLLIQK